LREGEPVAVGDAISTLWVMARPQTSSWKAAIAALP